MISGGTQLKTILDLIEFEIELEKDVDIISEEVYLEKDSDEDGELARKLFVNNVMKERVQIYE